MKGREQEEAVAFSYDSLDTSKPSLRLLSISPLLGDGIVRCSVRHAVLSDPDRPAYNALSYVWGDQSASSKRSIRLNGWPFEVNHNLHRFLLFVAKNESHREIRQNLWVDAVCIDQGNTRERNDQVRQMGEIYRGARAVFVWLGLEGRVQLGEQSWSSHLNSALALVGLRGLRRRPEDIAANPYWSRMWIVQELALARDVRVMCGPEIVRWEEVQGFLCRGHDEGGDAEEEGAAVRLAVALRDLRTELHGGTYSLELFAKCALSRLVLDYGGGRCADVRDKVFALLGLALDAGNFPGDDGAGDSAGDRGAGVFPVDYGASVCELFFLVLQWTRESWFPAIGGIRRTLGLSHRQLRHELARDTDSARPYVRWLYQFPVAKQVLQHEISATWTAAPHHESPFEAREGEETRLTPGDVIYLFAYETQARTSSRPGSGHGSKDYGFVMRREDGASRRFLSLCAVVPTAGDAGIRTTQVQRKLELFHCETFNLPPERQDTSSPVVSLTPAALLTASELAVFR